MSKFKSYAKKILIILISATLMIPSQTSLVFAKQDSTTELKDKVDTLIVLLGRILKDSYEDTKTQIKSEIVANDWDYSLTMSSFENLGNPYKNLDYVDLIACYMTLKSENSDDSQFKSISQMPFITYTSNASQITDTELLKINKYTETADGLFVKSGFDYTDEPIDIDDFEPYKDGFYKKIGTKHIEPKIETIRYGEITLSCITPDDLLKFYNADTTEIKEKAKKRAEKLQQIINNEEINQVLNAKVPTYLPETSYNYVTPNMTTEQKNLITVAQSLIGQVPYEWGGKSKFAGYDNTWWSFNDDNEQNGLDCSGYVQWIFRTAGYPEELCKKLLSTASTLDAGFQDISKEDLEVGDVGLLYKTAKEGTNHIGMYVGDGKWIHCSSGKGTVAVTDFKFRKFLRIIDSNNHINTVAPIVEDIDKESHKVEEEYIPKSDDEIKEDGGEVLTTTTTPIPTPTATPTPTPMPTATPTPVTKEQEVQAEPVPLIEQSPVQFNDRFSDEDVMVLAQIISHEAKSEGLNGWIAVGEVVLNRVNSSLFPNTVKEVVYQKGQFTSASSLSRITPTEEILNTARMLLRGQISILNNKNVLYFRNPTITSGLSASANVNWGKHQYYTYVGHHAFYIQ